MIFTISQQGVPLIRILMSRKTERAYKDVLQVIKKEIAPNMKFSSIIGDYELALRNAIEAVYPEVKLLGCWFHFNQVSYISRVYLTSKKY